MKKSLHNIDEQIENYIKKHKSFFDKLSSFIKKYEMAIFICIFFIIIFFNVLFSPIIWFIATRQHFNKAAPFFLYTSIIFIILLIILFFIFKGFLKWIIDSSDDEYLKKLYTLHKISIFFKFFSFVAFSFVIGIVNYFFEVFKIDYSNRFFISLLIFFTCSSFSCGSAATDYLIKKYELFKNS